MKALLFKNYCKGLVKSSNLTNSLRYTFSSIDKSANRGGRKSSVSYCSKKQYISWGYDYVPLTLGETT